MSLDIKDFRAIAGSSKSIGYVGQETGKDGEVKLVKLEAHRHLINITKADNFDANYHAAMRKAFLDALTGSFTDQQLGDATFKARIDAFLATARKMLGVSDDGVTSEVGNKPLDRRDVRALLLAHDLAFATYSDGNHAFVTDDGRQLNLSIGPESTKEELLDAYATAQVLRKTANSGVNVSKIIEELERYFCANYDRFGGNPMLVKMLANYELAGLNDHGAEAQQARRLAMGVLSAVFGGKILKADFQGVSAAKLQRLAAGAANGQMGLETVLEDLAVKDELDQTNCGEVLDIVDKFDQARQSEKDAIKLSLKEPPSQPQVQQSAAQQPAANQPLPAAFGVTVDDIRNFFADLISDSDTLALDKEQAEISKIKEDDPDEKANMANKIRQAHLKEVFFSHNKELAVLLTDQQFVQSLPADLKEMAKNVTTAAKPFFLLNAKALNDAESTANFLLTVDKSSIGCNFVFNLLQSGLDKAVKTQVEKLQENIAQEFARIMGQNGDEVKLTDLIGGKETGYKSIDDILAKLVSLSQKDGALKIKSTNDVLDDYGRYEIWKLTLPNGQTFRVEKGEIADASPLTEQGLEKSPQLLEKQQKAVEDRRTNQKAARLDAGKAVLEHLSSLIAADSRHGYGALMAEVMKRYFKDMSAADRRALIAAGIRFMKPEKPCPEGATEEERQKIADENQGAKLGALLKGAGPVMQKMLQGLSAMNLPTSFKVALEDMRSNLAPIPARVVKALLLELKRQNPNVMSIDAIESKGAASVGQTFLCRVTTKNGEETEEKEVIVKLIRPDAELRCQRERKIFEAAAREVDKKAAEEQGKTLGENEKGGMQITFAGQLAGILDELDLRLEAANVKKGGVYDDPQHGISSMKLDPAFKPTKFAMVVTKASGDPLDRVVRKFKDEVAELMKPFENNVADPENYSSSVNQVIENGKRLTTIHQQLLVHQRHLVELAKKWCDEGIYKGGFYHGDLHAGNIMVDTGHFKTEGGFLKRKEGPNGSAGPLDLDADEGLTVIDFGNAEDLKKEDRVNVLRMIAAGAARDTNRFMDGFKALMTPEGQEKFEAQRPKLHDMIHNVLNLGKMDQSGNRIAVVLGALQQLGFELPAPIFRFSQCQVRLQGTIDEVNGLIDQVGEKIANLRPNSMTSYQGFKASMSITDPLAFILHGNPTTVVSTIAQVKTQITEFVRVLNVKSDAEGDDSLPDQVDKVKDHLLTIDSTDGTTITGNLEKFAGNLKRLEGFGPQGGELQTAFATMRSNFSDEKVRQLEEKITREKELVYQINLLEQEVRNLGNSAQRLADAELALNRFKAISALPNGLGRVREVLNLFTAAQVKFYEAHGFDEKLPTEKLETALIKAIEDKFTADERKPFLVDDGTEKKKFVDGLDVNRMSDFLSKMVDADQKEFEKQRDHLVKQSQNAGELASKRLELANSKAEQSQLRGEITTLKNEFADAFKPVGKLFCAVEKAALEKLLEAYTAMENNLDLTEKDDFCTALGQVIKDNKGSSLWDLGLVTVVEYKVTGKLNG